MGYQQINGFIFFSNITGLMKLKMNLLESTSFQKMKKN